MVAAAEQKWAFYMSRCTDQHISMMECQYYPSSNYIQGHTLINKGHCSQYLNLYDLSPLRDPEANLADIQGVIVPIGPRVGVHVVYILPRLR